MLGGNDKSSAAGTGGSNGARATTDAAPAAFEAAGRPHNHVDPIDLAIQKAKDLGWPWMLFITFFFGGNYFLQTLAGSNRAFGAPAAEKLHEPWSMFEKVYNVSSAADVTRVSFATAFGLFSGALNVCQFLLHLARAQTQDGRVKGYFAPYYAAVDAFKSATWREHLNPVTSPLRKLFGVIAYALFAYFTSIKTVGDSPAGIALSLVFTFGFRFSLMSKSFFCGLSKADRDEIKKLSTSEQWLAFGLSVVQLFFLRVGILGAFNGGDTDYFTEGSAAWRYGWQACGFGVALCALDYFYDWIRLSWAVRKDRLGNQQSGVSIVDLGAVASAFAVLLGVLDSEVGSKAERIIGAIVTLLATGSINFGPIQTLAEAKAGRIEVADGDQCGHLAVAFRPAKRVSELSVPLSPAGASADRAA